jgi:hypothetical protein
LIVKPILAKRSISPKSLRDVDAGTGNIPLEVATGMGLMDKRRVTKLEKG